MNSPLLSLRNIHVELGGVPVLHGVNADVERGRITALIGLNGSGKTTLLRCILRELPFQGTLTFHCGHDHSRPDPRHVGYVPQKLRIEARLPLTVCDLLGLALMKRPLFLGVSRALRERMVQMLARVWLGADFLDRPVEKISGGELQRVLLTLALEPSPELLLLDEPAAGIDFQTSGDFYGLLARLNSESGVTIVLVSHDLSVVSHHAHHVLCLRDGRIQCQGAPAEVLRSEVIAQTFGSNSGVFDHHH
jgi:zinc transport system ATP-binding protein